MKLDDIYINFWGKPKPKFTELQLALMEGGHSLEEPKFQFLASLKDDRGARRDNSPSPRSGSGKTRF